MKVDIERVPGTIDITYDHVCWTCNDEGDARCPSCGGVGHVLTSEGEELVTFIERHFHLVRKKRDA
jgi:Ribonuclease G/E